MANVLKWTDRALEEYDQLVNYLYSEWGEDIALRVISEIDQTVNRIRDFPEHFPVFTKRAQVRRCVASPQTSIFFKIKKNGLKFHLFSIIAKIPENENYK